MHVSRQFTQCQQLRQNCKKLRLLNLKQKYGYLAQNRWWHSIRKLSAIFTNTTPSLMFRCLSSPLPNGIFRAVMVLWHPCKVLEIIQLRKLINWCKKSRSMHSHERFTSSISTPAAPVIFSTPHGVKNIPPWASPTTTLRRCALPRQKSTKEDQGE